MEKLENINSDKLVDMFTSPRIDYLRNLRLADFPLCKNCAEKEYCMVCPQSFSNATGDMFTPSQMHCHTSNMICKIARGYKDNAVI